MSRWWHRRQPEIVDQIRSDLRLRQPRLHFLIHGEGNAEVRGTFSVLSVRGKILDGFRVSIELPPDYPTSLPVVREVGGRIPWHEDYHVERDGIACVLLPDDRWRCFSEDTPFAQYLDGPLHDFFLGQSLVALGGDWPFGEWSHGPEGFREFYKEFFHTDDEVTVKRHLDILSKLKLKGHFPCPCGSGQKIRKCCQTQIIELRKKIPPAIARKAFERLGFDPNTRRRSRRR